MQSIFAISRCWYDSGSSLKRTVLLILAILVVESLAFPLAEIHLAFSPIYLLAFLRATDILILVIWGSWHFRGPDITKPVKDALLVTLVFVGAGLVFLTAWKSVFGSSMLKWDGAIFNQSRPTLIIFYITSCLLSPVAEELFFRGLLYRTVRDKWNVLCSIGVVSIVFAWIHYFITKNAVEALLPFLGSLIFCVGYEKTKFILAPILLHVSGNLIIYLSPFLGFI
jgi:membrane protease YdiL (CAAX protease family)